MKRIGLLIMCTLCAFSSLNGVGFSKSSDRKQMSRAIEKGERRKVKRLLKAGMDLQSISEDGSRFTLLHEAAYYQRPRIAKYFIKHGADVNERLYNHNVPLHSAMGPVGFEDPAAALEIVGLLIGSGAVIDKRGVGGATPLHLACEKQQYVEVMKVLLDSGANIEAQRDNGWTPLISASLSENVGGIDLLLERGANLESCCNRKLTALSSACLEGKLQAAELLIEGGANVNARGFCGETPLMLATLSGRVAIVELLIANGVDLNARTTKKIEWKKDEQTAFGSLWDLIPWKKISWLNSQNMIPKKSTALDIARKFGGGAVETALVNAGAR